MPSLRTAINEKCKDCAYDPLDVGNWRQQVTDCGGVDCPLYPLRPVTRGKDRKETKRWRRECER